MSEWKPGPTWAELAKKVKDEKERHGRHWGNKSGLRLVQVDKLDLDELKKLLTLFGQNIPLPDLGGTDDCYLFRSEYKAAFVGYGAGHVQYKEDEDGRDEIHGDLSFGLTGNRLEELYHKVLAAAGLVPFRKMHIPEDLDKDGLVWIKWNDDGEPIFKDA